jgi:hypothetical protein
MTKSKKYSKTYEAEIDLVAHEHWVAVFKDHKNSQHIRQLTKDDAWKYDVQKGCIVLLEVRPYNKCKILKVTNRPL